MDVRLVEGTHSVQNKSCGYYVQLPCQQLACFSSLQIACALLSYTSVPCCIVLHSRFSSWGQVLTVKVCFGFPVLSRMIGHIQCGPQKIMHILSKYARKLGCPKRLVVVFFHVRLLVQLLKKKPKLQLICFLWTQHVQKAGGVPFFSSLAVTQGAPQVEKKL